MLVWCGARTILTIQDHLDAAICLQLSFQDRAEQGVLGVAECFSPTDNLELLIAETFLLQESGDGEFSSRLLSQRPYS